MYNFISFFFVIIIILLDFLIISRSRAASRESSPHNYLFRVEMLTVMISQTTRKTSKKEGKPRQQEASTKAKKNFKALK